MAEFVAYYRVSTQRQGQSGLGLEAQREAVVRFIGQPPINEYVEVESGRRPRTVQSCKALWTTVSAITGGWSLPS